MENKYKTQYKKDISKKLPIKTISTSIKKHECIECEKDIHPGTKYYLEILGRDDIATFRMCLDCKSINDQFFTIWFYGDVLHNFKEYLHMYEGGIPFLKTELTKLTPTALKWVESQISNYHITPLMA